MSLKAKQQIQYTEIAHFLRDLLESRKEKNSKYSMRAFARDLKTSPARMSALMSGRAMPGKIVRTRILTSFNLSAEQSDRFNFLIVKALQDRKNNRPSFQVVESAYKLMPEWHHYAILNLMETIGFKKQPEWIADRLCIDADLVRSSIQNLLAANLIKEAGDTLVPVHQHTAVTPDIPSEAIRNYHRQMMTHSLKALETVPLELRDFTALIVPTNPRQIEKAKLLVRQFRQDLNKLLEEGEKTEVYNVCIQIAPASKISNIEMETL